MMSDRLHQLTHAVPGVPEHRDHNAPSPVHSHAGRHHQGHAHRTTRHTREPRVLVRWQRWIASLADRDRA
jgi:hypothetical protein